MNTNQEMPIPPPYPAKMNQPLPVENYQQMSYSNPSVPQGQSVLIGNPMTMVAGNYPVACNCPYCYQPIMTRVEKNDGLAVWLSAALICFFGCFCGCCFIPFCIDSFKDTIHYCPNCNRVITQNKKL